VKAISHQYPRVEPRVGHESLLQLVRRPVVQLILVTVAAAQVVTVGARERLGTADSGSTEMAEMRLAPAIVTPGSSAWLDKAVSREADRLAAEYRDKGYSVTPQLAKQIGDAAAEFEISPETAFGLVRAESGFRNAATSAVGAVGLTQLMPRTASWMQPGTTRSDLRDAETNLRIGFKYLRYLIDRYEGNERLALLAYNRGPGTVDKALKKGRNPDNGYADFVHGKANNHKLFTR
jgi:soluble lytic murein transglycosylase-like protein